MSGMMSNPQVLDQIIAQNPQLAAMGPQVREVFQSERFRQMMSNPESLRTMLQMSQMMQGAGGSPFGGGMGGGGGGGFPAPGNPGGAPNPNPSSPGAGATPQSPGQGMPNLASLLGGAGAGAGGAPSPGGGAPPAFDPAAMQQMLGMFGGGGGGGGMGAGANAFGGGFGGAPAAPADTRAPEERFQVQLQVCYTPSYTVTIG